MSSKFDRKKVVENRLKRIVVVGLRVIHLKNRNTLVLVFSITVLISGILFSYFNLLKRNMGNGLSMFFDDVFTVK